MFLPCGLYWVRTGVWTRSYRVFTWSSSIRLYMRRELCPQKCLKLSCWIRLLLPQLWRLPCSLCWWESEAAVTHTLGAKRLFSHLNLRWTAHRRHRSLGRRLGSQYRHRDAGLTSVYVFMLHTLLHTHAQWCLMNNDFDSEINYEWSESVNVQCLARWNNSEQNAAHECVTARCVFQVC